MPELDPVRQEVILDASQALATMDDYIAKAQAFVDACAAMQASLDEVAVAANDAAVTFGAAASQASDVADAMARVAAPAQAAASALDSSGQAAAVASAGFDAVISRLDDLVMLGGAAVSQLHDLRDALLGVAAAATASSAAAGTAGTAWRGWLGFLGGSTPLFAGVMAVATWHALADAIVEFGTTLLEAGVAVAAFGAFAAPTFQHIYVQLQGIWTASNALNTAIYPLSAGFSSLDRAVQPEAMQLFGEALVAVNAHAGEFQALAASAGGVLDQLGARFVAAIDNGGTFNSFLADGTRSLQEWGDIIGNVGGILGNFFRTLPGYANVLTHALVDLTGALEAITANGVVQWLMQAGLWMHGFIIWTGLAVTAVTVLGNAFLGLAGKIVPALAQINLFDAAQFMAGIQAMVTGLGDMALGFAGVSVAEEGATGSTLALAGAMGALDAASPMLWIIGVTAAVVGLVYAFTRATSATSAYDTAVKNALSNAPVTDFSSQVMIEQTATTQRLTEATKQLGDTQEYMTTENVHTGVQMRVVTSEYQQQQSVVSGYKGELQTLQTYQSNYNAVLKAAGGNVAMLTAANITSNQIMSASGQQLKALEVQAMAAAASFSALQLGVGRNAAAMNALNYAGDTTANVLGSLDVDMQKVVTGQNDLVNVVLGAEQSLVSFDQGLLQIQTDAAAAGASLNSMTTSTGKLNASSVTLASDYYSTMLPAMQKTITAMEMQLPTTSQLTNAIGIMAQQMLPYAQGNQGATASLITLINSALGPGTVSFQNLNQWVQTNGGSLATLNGIIGQTTTQASVLSNTLGSDLNAQFASSILKYTGAQQALSQYTQDLVMNQQNTVAGQTDRQNLINDLVAAGLSAQQAQTYVDGLATALGKVQSPPPVTIKVTTYYNTVGVPPSAAGAGGAGIAGGGGHTQSGMASGGYVHGRGTATSDSIPAWLSRGEYVMKADAVAHYGIHAMNALNARRLATGGPASAGLVPSVLEATLSGGGGPINLHSTSVNNFRMNSRLLTSEIRADTATFSRRNPAVVGVRGRIGTPR